MNQIIWNMSYILALLILLKIGGRNSKTYLVETNDAKNKKIESYNRKLQPIEGTYI